MVNLHIEGHFQFRAHAIDARYENRIQVRFRDRKKTPKSPDLAEHALSEGLVSQVLDALLGSIGAINVNASVGVRDGGGLGGVWGHENLSVFMNA
jgi:hypothetical protein